MFFNRQYRQYLVAIDRKLKIFVMLRFALPRKLICMNTSGSYKPETHQVTPMVLRAEQVCTYDLDNVDKAWLEALNGERALGGLQTVTESEMERTVEELEKQCREKINSTLRNTDDVDIAQDDSIICDVCRSVSNYPYKYFTRKKYLWNEAKILVCPSLESLNPRPQPTVQSV